MKLVDGQLHDEIETLVTSTMKSECMRRRAAELQYKLQELSECIG
jgi:hypothetical protein